LAISVLNPGGDIFLRDPSERYVQWAYP